MERTERKVFVGGYYDDRIFRGEYFEGKTPFDKEINCYTLEEALKLPFVEGVKEWFEENSSDKFYKISNEEKIKAILNYIENDEIASLIYFESEEVAEKYKKDTLKEIEKLEKEIKYIGKEQDERGVFREVYRQRKDFEYGLKKYFYNPYSFYLFEDENFRDVEDYDKLELSMDFENDVYVVYGIKGTNKTLLDKEKINKNWDFSILDEADEVKEN